MQKTTVKIMLLIIILLIFVNQLICSDEKIFIPKKLITAELPENYPKELDYLFQEYEVFYNNFYTMLDEGETNEKLIFDSLYDSYSEEMKKYLTYLVFLGYHTIPEYMDEFDRLYSIPYKNSSKTDIYSKNREGFITQKISNDFPDISIPRFIVFVSRFMRENETTIPDGNNLYFYLMLKVEVISCQLVTVDSYLRNNSIFEDKRYLINAKILDEVSESFDRENITFIMQHPDDYLGHLDEELFKKGDILFTNVYRLFANYTDNPLEEKPVLHFHTGYDKTIPVINGEFDIDYVLKTSSIEEFFLLKYKNRNCDEYIEELREQYKLIKKWGQNE